MLSLHTWNTIAGLSLIQGNTLKNEMTKTSSSGSSSDQQRSTQKTVVYCSGLFSEANTIAYNTENMSTLTSVTRAVLFPSSTNLAATLEFLNLDATLWFWKLNIISPTSMKLM